MYVGGGGLSFCAMFSIENRQKYLILKRTYNVSVDDLSALFLSTFAFITIECGSSISSWDSRLTCLSAF